MIKINLLATREVKKRDTFQQQIMLFVVCLLVGVGGIAYVHINVNKKIKTVQTENENVKKQLDSLRKEVGDLNEYKKKTEDLESKRNIINALEVGRNGPVHLLDEFSQAMPQSIWIDEFTLKGDALTVKGLASDNETIATFMMNLSNRPYFTVVNLVRSEKTTSGGLTVNRFTLTMKIKYPAPEKPAEKKPEIKEEKKTDEKEA
ncbi:MAG: PilN domain-containing protein [Candidatus Dadabacteria bacterium]|nr:PilN domain-containing protein [Candidatus Dadabacteria bacterium]